MDDRSKGMGAVVRRSTTHRMSSGKYAGRTFEFMQLGIRDLVQCQEECTENFKRQQLQTYTRNVDLIPKDMRESMIRDAFAAAAQIHYESLPSQRTKIAVKDDAGNIVKDDAGDIVTMEVPVEYVMWWVNETVHGKLYSSWLSMRKCPSNGNLSLDDVDDIFVEALADLNAATDKIGSLSTTRVLGNAEAPAAQEQPPERKSRRERIRERQRRKTLASLQTGLG